jgi:hypothetical protein
MQTFTDIFEKLLEDKQIDVEVTGSTAESLRVSLIRKWTKYKKQYDSLGFLSDEMKSLSVSMTKLPVDETTGIGGTRYSLRQKTNRATYQILESKNE